MILAVNTNVSSDANNFASLGPNPLERIYEQLIIITMILKQAYSIQDEDYNYYSVLINPVNPNVNPNFTEPL